MGLHRVGHAWSDLAAAAFSLSSIQYSVMSDPLQPHGLQHARLLCPSPTPGVCSNSCPLSQWCHPTILSSVVLLPHLAFKNFSLKTIGELGFWAPASCTSCLVPCNKGYTFLHHNLVSVDWPYCAQVNRPKFGHTCSRRKIVSLSSWIRRWGQKNSVWTNLVKIIVTFF